MKCPLFHSEFIRMQAPELAQSNDCLKEECAWWNKSENECCCFTTSRELSVIKASLYQLANIVHCDVEVRR